MWPMVRRGVRGQRFRRLRATKCPVTQGCKVIEKDSESGGSGHSVCSGKSRPSNLIGPAGTPALQNRLPEIRIRNFASPIPTGSTEYFDGKALFAQR